MNILCSFHPTISAFEIQFLRVMLQKRKGQSVSQSTVCLSTYLTTNFSPLIIKTGHKSHRTVLFSFLCCSRKVDPCRVERMKQPINGKKKKKTHN